MNPNFELYRIFYTVAKHNNITKASEELYISQPAVSKAIKNLENNLGGKLFNRTKKGVILTEEGKEFYNYISIAIEYINNAERKFSDLINLETGTIKIGISNTLTKYFLVKHLKKFHEMHPNINIQIHTDITNLLIDKLKNGLIDLVVLNLPYGNVNNIEIIRSMDVHDSFYVNDSYKELLKEEISIKDLNKYPLILMSKKSNSRHILDKFCNDYHVKLQAYMELAGYSLVYEFTKMGYGIGCLTDEFIDQKDKYKIYKLNIKEKIPKRSIGIAYSKTNLPSFATKELIKIITKNTNQ